MGRSKGFKKDRMYITQTEWVNEWGGKKVEREKRPAQKALQFYCCNLTLQPWTDPVCTSNGVIYDLLAIIPWIKKYKVDPVTGETLKSEDLIKLNFYKNQEGKFHCPITYKVYTDFTHIVAIRNTGNVYAYEAIDNLNIRPKHWNDLVTGEAFTKSDIINLQDPNDNSKQVAVSYYHIRKGLTPGSKAEDLDPIKNITLTSTSEKVFREIREKERVELMIKQKEEEEAQKLGISKPKPPKAPQYLPTDSASFTSSAFTPKPVTDEGFKPKKTTKKGFVTLVTNAGNLNLQLHCDLVPLACENFLTLCENGFYKNTIFHRNIRHFMIQGGDPTATGKGGKSMWGKEFPDEFIKSLKHDGAGVLSMANYGKNTNTSQFFICYKSAPHLNNKHTVFGKLVGGMDVLKSLALIESDVYDKPLMDIMILDTVVYLNPFSKEEIEKEQQEEKLKKDKEKEKQEFGQWLSHPQAQTSTIPQSTETSVGKYLSKNIPTAPTQKRSLDFGEITQQQQITQNPSRKKQKTSSYGDFSQFG